MLIVKAYPDQWASDWSEELAIDAAQDTVAPVAPSSFAISSVAEGIELTWVNPTLNDDGTACNDLDWIAVYRSTSSGIDPTNPSTYDKRILTRSESYIYKTTDTTTTFYFMVTAIDRTKNESTATGELSSTATAISVATSIPDDATGLIFDDTIGGDGVVSGDGILGIAFQQPAATWVNFDHYKLLYQYTTDGGTTWRDENGVAGQWTEIGPVDRWGVMQKGLDSTGARAYRYEAKVVARDHIESTTPDTAGGASTTADASDNDGLALITIFAVNIVALNEVRAKHIAASTITADKLSFAAFVIGTNSLDDVGDGTTYERILKTDISAGHILLSETVGSLDNISDGSAYGKVASTSISAGKIVLTSGAGVTGTIGASQTDTTIISGGKIITGLLTADNIQTGTLDASVVNIVNLTVSGVITCQAGSSYAGNIISTAYTAADVTSLNTAADTAKVQGSTIIIGGYIATSFLTASNIITGTLDASVVNIVNLTVSGVITCQAGSSYVGNAIGTAYTAAKATDPNADQTSANTAADTAKVQGSTIIIGGYIATSFLTADNIITGTLNASYVTVTNLDATNITAGTMSFARISQSSVDIISSMIHAGAVDNAAIATDAVRTNEIYLDGSLNFNPSGTARGITGIGHIYFDGGGMTITQGQVIASGTMQLGFNSKNIILTNAATSGGQWGLGYINVTINGVARSIAIENSH